MVHGTTPDEVMRDLEGVQTMQILGENMAYMLGCIAAGRERGVPVPQLRPRINTNFIREE